MVVRTKQTAQGSRPLVPARDPVSRRFQNSKSNLGARLVPTFAGSFPFRAFSCPLVVSCRSLASPIESGLNVNFILCSTATLQVSNIGRSLSMGSRCRTPSEPIFERNVKVFVCTKRTWIIQVINTQVDTISKKNHAHHNRCRLSRLTT